VSVAFDAKINACADGVFNITILVPERYDPDEIKTLKVGDGIFTEGREIEIRTCCGGSASRPRFSRWKP